MIVLLGDSHARAVVNGYAALTDKERDDIDAQTGGFLCGMLGAAFAFGEAFWQQTEAGIVFNGPLQAQFERIVGTDHAVITKDDPRKFILSMGAQPSFLHIPGQWNAHTAGDHVDGLQHVSRAGFRAGLLHYNRYTFGFFKALKALNVSFSVMGEPPLSPEYAFIAQKGERAIAMWRLHVAEFRAALQSLDIQIEEPPAAVYENGDKSGYLRLPLHDAAAVASPHGNKIYGEIFLRAMLADRGATKVANDEAKLIPWLNDPARLLEWRTTLAFNQANMRKPSAPDLFRKALVDAPDNAKLSFGLAYALERTDDTPGAIAQYEKTLEAHPDYAECWAAFGKLRLAGKDYAQAQACFDKALLLDPGMNDLRLLLGAIWERMGNFDKVKNLLGPALKASQAELDKAAPERRLIPEPDPYFAATRKPIGPAPYYIIYARMKLKFGDPLSAEKYFKRAIQIDPSKLVWNAYLADIAYDRAEWDAAATYYDIALAAAPDVAKYSARLAECRKKAAAA